MKDCRKAILEAMDTDHSYSVKELVSVTHFSPSACREALNGLYEGMTVTRSMVGRKYLYQSSQLSLL